MKNFSGRKWAISPAAVLAVAALFVGSTRSAMAQQVIVDFRFTDGTTTMNLTSGAAAQTITANIWVTVVPASTTAGNQLGLQSVAFRGVDDGGAAFQTGSGIGVVSASFTSLHPFTAGFAQPGISDIGKTTNSGSTVTSGADGIVDFGGTITAQRANFLSDNGSPQLGGTASNTAGGPITQANTTTTPNGWQWEVGTFQFKIGTVNASGTTLFYPTLLTTAQGAASAAAFTTNGGSTTSTGPITVGTPLTFTVQTSGGGNDSVVNLSASAATINMLAGGKSTTSVTIHNSAADASTANGTASVNATLTGTNAANATASFIGSPAGSVNNVDQAVTLTYNASGASAGTTATFNYNIANASNAADTSGTKQTVVSVNVGGATADTTGAGTFTAGNALTATVAASGSYASLASKVTNSSATPSAGRNGQVNLNNNNPSFLGGDAVILSGSNSSSTTAANVSMNWRMQTQAETLPGSSAGNKMDPSLLKPTTGLVSNVVDVSGITATGTTGPGNSTITDDYVLQMSYNPSLLPKGFRFTSAQLATEEGQLATNKLIYMVSLNTTTGLWELANAGNVNNITTSNKFTDPNQGFVGSFGSFLTNWNATHSGAQLLSSTTPSALTKADLDKIMGAWGTDTSNHVTWAVLDHNSSFAVVPEPSTMVLAGVGLMGLAVMVRRRRVAIA